MTTTPRHRRERGGATLLLITVLLVFAVLLGAIAVRGASSDLQMATSQRAGRMGFYCAEAGLNAARATLAANFGQWNTMFANGAVTGFTYPITGDLDGDGRIDYSVTLIDNYDELPPLVNDPLHDNDLAAVMVSDCNSNTLGAGFKTRELREIITYQGQLGFDYRYQAGHSSTHSGNEN